MDTTQHVTRINSLLSWAQIFKIEASHQDTLDFLDGIAFAEILHEIDPVFFEPRWLDGFVPDCGNSWRLKMTNLQRVLSRIHDFFLEITGSTVSLPELLPDVRLLSEFQGEPDKKPVANEAVYRFLQLIVGCAVSCARRQHFIQAILELETDVQAGVMEAVKMVIERNDGKVDTAEENIQQSQFAEASVTEDMAAVKSQLQVALQKRDELAERVKQLEQELAFQRNRVDSGSHAQKSDVDDDNIREQFTSRVGGVSSETSLKRASTHDEIERLRDEMEKLDAARDDWRQKAENAEHEAAVLRSRVAELVSVSRETKRLRDELDVARHAVERLAIAETQIEQLQRKVEQTSAAQRKLRSVEEKLQTVMNENTTLQDQLNRLRTVSKRRSNFDQSDSGEKLDAEDVTSSLRVDLLQRQFEETTTKLAETREQLTNALSQNRSLADENTRLRETATETASAGNYDSLPSLIRDENDISDNAVFDSLDRDNVVLSLKSEIARRKNEALIMEQRYKKYLERARAIVKLVSVAATANNNCRGGTGGPPNEFNVGASFVSNSSALSMMRSQLRLLAEGNSRYFTSSPLVTTPSNGPQQNHGRIASETLPA